MTLLLLLFAAGIWAGAQNALAGGGSFVTLPALILAGLDPRAANITSTIAMFPGQVATGWAGRSNAGGIGRLSFAWLAGLSLIGGGLGAALLLATPPDVFARLVPWFVLFATAVFAWGSFGRRPDATMLGPRAAAASQFGISIYGGYFSGGIGILMMAGLTLAGMAVRQAGATKNVLAGFINLSAVALFAAAADIAWREAAALGAGALLGGVAGAWGLARINERALKWAVVAIGLALTVGLFWREA